MRRWQIIIDWRHLGRLVALVAWVLWRAGWRYAMMLLTAVGVLSSTHSIRSGSDPWGTRRRPRRIST
jgi:hypothetical protein